MPQGRRLNLRTGRVTAFVDSSRGASRENSENAASRAAPVAYVTRSEKAFLRILVTVMPAVGSTGTMVVCRMTSESITFPGYYESHPRIQCVFQIT